MNALNFFVEVDWIEDEVLGVKMKRVSVRVRANGYQFYFSNIQDALKFTGELVEKIGGEK